MNTKQFCLEWYNNTSKKNWYNFTVENIQHDLDNIPEECDRPDGTAQDVYETMLEIIAEDNAINKPENILEMIDRLMAEGMSEENACTIADMEFNIQG